MRWPQILALRLRSLFRRGRVESELDDELHFHLEQQIAANLHGGMSAQDARLAALRSFGGVAQTKEECRDARSLGWLADSVRDLRFSLRALARTPSYTALSIATLALGIGVSAAAFSILNAVLLRPLPYPKADRLVFLHGSTVTSNNVSLWQQNARRFDAMSALDPGLADVDTSNGPERVDSLLVSPGFFSMLGLRATAGRVFVGDDFRSGAVVIISDRLATRLFGSPTAAVGRMLHLVGTGYSNETFQIVGTLDSPGPLPYASNWNLMLPLVPMPRAELSPMIGRLKPGVTLAAARSEAEGIARSISGGKASTHGWSPIELNTLKAQVVGDSALTVRLIFAAALLLLLITCANVAHLVLARSASRTREIALRTALGATRGRVARELLAESTLLCGAAALLGLWISNLALRALIDLIPYRVPRLAESRTDAAVFLFAAGAALLISFVFALAPLLETRDLDVNQTLKEASRQVGGHGRRWLRSALVVTEIAIACIVMITAGLLVEAFLALRPANPGFNPHGKLILRVGNTRSSNEQSIPLVTDLQDRIASLPGVRGVAVNSELPMTGMSWVPDVQVAGQTVNGGASANAIHFRAVSANYLATMAVPIVAGRDLTAADIAQKLPVLVVNQTFARRYFNGSPLGQQVSILSGGPAKAGALTIVGVAADGRIFGNVAGSRPEAFLPFSDAPVRGFWIVVDTFSDPLTVVPAVREVVRSLAPQAVVSDVQTMDRLLDDSVAQPRFHALLLGGLAGLAVLLALAGIYAVMSYTVAQRTHEMGVRVALGARATDVLRVIMGSALRLAGLGILIGGAAALALSGALRGLLFGIAPTDPRSYVAAALVLGGLALAASYLPARRATRVDPMVALRYE